jgi:muramoyltetrapeptide carboxypeptidase
VSNRALRLKTGDTIGIIAPAGPVSKSEILSTIETLEDRGYQIFHSPNLYQRENYLAGSDVTRVSDLHMMFRDNNIKAILCARGGYGTPRIIEKIDYDLIRKNPKIFIGFSDITAILLAIYNETELVTFHGPMAKGLVANGERNLDNLLKVLSSEGPIELSLANGISLKEGKAKGRLFGGNLSLISSLVGTRFLPPLDGEILFIEERGEPLYRIDRMLTHLRLSGLLGGLAGLIVGEFKDCDDTTAIDRLLKDRTADLEFPVLSGLPVGHGIENITLPIGLRVEIDTESMMIHIPNPVISK